MLQGKAPYIDRYEQHLLDPVGHLNKNKSSWSRKLGGYQGGHVGGSGRSNMG